MSVLSRSDARSTPRIRRRPGSRRRQKRDVGGQKAIPSPGVLRVSASPSAYLPDSIGRMLLPNDLAREVQFGDRLHLLVRTHVEELLAVLCMDLNTVAAPLKLLAERPRTYFPAESNTKIDGWSGCFAPLHE